MAGVRKKRQNSPQRQDAPVLPQAGVLPYRWASGGGVEVLLIRRRHKRRWGIPKGVIEQGDTAPQTACREALEEAGIAGRISDAPLGQIEYSKWGCVCRVAVYALLVTKEHAHFDEELFRERRWFRPGEAADRKTRKGVRRIMVELVRRLATQG